MLVRGRHVCEVVCHKRADVTGYQLRREELIGTPFSDYFQDADQATASVKETFNKGVVSDYVLTLARRGGRT